MMQEILSANVNLDSSEEELYQKVFNKVTKTVLKKAKELDKHLPVLFNSANYDTAFEQGFKAKGKHSTFTLYIDFKLPTTKWKLVGLGEDASRPADCVLHIPEPSNQEAWRSLIEEDLEGRSFVSPFKLNALLVRTVDQALANIKNSVKIGNSLYSVSRLPQQSTECLLVDGPGVNFTVQLLPCFSLQMKHLKGFPALKNNVEDVMTKAKVDLKAFKVVANKTNPGNKLEATFPDIEQSLLKSSGCLRDVMTKLQHHLATEIGVLPKSWAHILRACFLHLVIEHLGEEADFWDQSSMELRMSDCVECLYCCLQKNSVTDIFFPQVFSYYHIFQLRCLILLVTDQYHQEDSRSRSHRKGQGINWRHTEQI